MPKTQIANIGHYPFGAGITENAPLTWRVRQGCRLTVRAENNSDRAIAVTLQVSADGSSWSDTAATPNGTAVADVSVPVRQHREWQVNLRQGQDLWFRLQAVGGGQGNLQIRGDENLEIHSV